MDEKCLAVAVRPLTMMVLLGATPLSVIRSEPPETEADSSDQFQPAEAGSEFFAEAPFGEALFGCVFAAVCAADRPESMVRSASGLTTDTDLISMV